MPLPVTNWASDEEKLIPNYSVEIIIFFILWSVEIIIFFILWSQHPYYDFNIHIMISTSNFSKLWSQQQISPNYDLNSVCVRTNTIFFKTKTKTYYFSHLHSLEFHLFFALIVPFKNIRMWVFWLYLVENTNTDSSTCRGIKRKVWSGGIGI